MLKIQNLVFKNHILPAINGKNALACGRNLESIIPQDHHVFTHFFRYFNSVCSIPTHIQYFLKNSSP